MVSPNLEKTKNKAERIETKMPHGRIKDGPHKRD